ncbi:MAG: YCF48-related protein, partial [Bacteroidota bacterium]
MKKAILVLIAFVMAAPLVHAQENWTTVLSPAFDGFLNDTQFLSETEGWAVGSNGTIKQTTDGGLTWTDMSAPGYEDLTFESVHFLDANTGWVGARQALLLKTEDGGQNWTEVSLQELVPHLDVNQFRGLQFLNADVGYMVIGRHNNSYMFKSEDGGTSWAVQDSLIGGNWLDFDFHDVNNGVIVSNNASGQFYTSDGGQTWNSSNELTAVSNLTALNAVRWIDADNVIAFGQGNSFQNLTTTAYLSGDGGETFEAVTFDPAMTMDVFTGLLVLDSDNILAFGHNRATRPVVARSTDGGSNWTTELQDFSVNFQKATMAGNRIIVQGSSSSLFYSDDNGTSFEFLGAHPYSEIRYLQFGDGYGYAVNSNSKLFSYDSENDAFELVGPSLYNSPGRGNNMFFQDETTGFIHKGNRHIVKTTDGGQNWTTVLEDIPNSFNNRSGGIWFTDENTGYAWLSTNTGTAYSIYRTTDGGDNWDEHLAFTGPANIAGVMKFFTDDIGVIAGPRRNVIRTEDAFATEPVTEFQEEGFPVDFSATADFRDMVILDDVTAWAVGNGFMLKTGDAGATWEWVDPEIDYEGFDGNFYSLAVSGNRAYAVTFGGYIIKSEDGGDTWSVDDTFAGERIFITAEFHDGRVFIGSTIGEIIAGEEAVEDPLAGDYFIPQGVEDQGFADLAEAIEALNERGAGSAVNWYLTGDLDHSDAELPIIQRDDLTGETPLTIAPAPGAEVTVSFSGAHGLAMDNTGWVTVDGDNEGGQMTFLMNQEGGAGSGLISITEDASNIAVRNLNLQHAFGGGQAFRLRQAYSGTGSVSPNTVLIEDNTIGTHENTFNDGLAIWGSADIPVQSVEVAGNLIYAGRRGITTFYVEENTYRDNEMYVTGQVESDIWHGGIYLAGGVGEINIHGNRILEVAVNGAGYAGGILLNGSDNGVNVYNNYIAMNVPNLGESEANNVYGIVINFPNAGNPLNIMHNSIYLPETG